MHSTPKVSVMVLCYNHAHLIRETLDSVLAQDYDNLEIVVADDASTDGSQEILRQYAAGHPGKFVLVFNERNLGITGNSNAAFFACTGDLIAVLAGDDVFSPGKISSQVEEFVKNPEVVLCYHPVEIFESSTNKTLYITDQNPRQDIQNAEGIVLRTGIPGASSVMVRRAACPPRGFDTRLPTVSDWLFFTEVALKGKVAKVNGVFGRYRKHQQGMTNRLAELLDESLYGIDLVVQKHPERPELARICQKGKARYIAGEAFRQMNKNGAYAYRLSQQAVALDPKNFRYRLLLLLCKYKLVVQIVGPLLNRNKYLIKKYLVSDL